MLNQTAPHFLLLTQAHSNRANTDPSQSRCLGGTWRFLIERMGTSKRIEVTEKEPGVWGERLQLLAVVRGLEALEQPSRVTLITPSRYVCNGIRHNIGVWRENDWQWEKFGEMISIKNLDLWQRIDHAMHYHTIDCRAWEFNSESLSTRSSRPNRKVFGHIPFENEAEFRFLDRQSQNRITFEELRRSKVEEIDRLAENNASGIPIKPMGRGRAFGLCIN